MTTAVANVAVKKSSEAFSIRPAKFEDMDKIAEFVRSSAEWYRPFVDPKDMDEHEVDDEWAKENYAKRDFYIGSADGKDIGTISLQFFGDYVYLGYIYLDVNHVGHGYGQQLMKFAEGIARDSGYRGMALIAHPEAAWAKRAYLKYGFDIAETEKEAVITWCDGCLESYYEQGFELYLYEFADREDEAADELVSALA